MLQCSRNLLTSLFHSPIFHTVQKLGYIHSIFLLFLFQDLWLHLSLKIFKYIKVGIKNMGSFMQILLSALQSLLHSLLQNPWEQVNALLLNFFKEIVVSKFKKPNVDLTSIREACSANEIYENLKPSKNKSISFISIGAASISILKLPFSSFSSFLFPFFIKQGF